MNKNQEVIDVLDCAITKVESCKRDMSDYLQMLEILVEAAKSFKTILEKRGNNNECEIN